MEQCDSGNYVSRLLRCSVWILLTVSACSAEQSQEGVGSVGTTPAAERASTIQRDAIAEPTTLCAVYEDPDRYVDKLVEVKGAVLGRDRRDLWIDSFESSPCSAYMRIQLVFPDDYSELIHDAGLEAFEEALDRPSDIEGTFQGVFLVLAGVDGASTFYDAQIVLTRVLEIRTYPLLEI